MASMNELLTLLKDGNARSVDHLAAELDTSIEDIERMLEYMEKMGILKRTELGKVGCSDCSTCPGHNAGNGANSPCAGCMPEGGFKNMGVIWEVV